MVAKIRVGAPLMRSITAHRLQWVIGGVVSVGTVCLLTAAAAAAATPAPDWVLIGLVVAGTFAGYHTQVAYSIGGQRLLLLWCQAPAAVALVMETPAWMVLTTAAGWAVTTFGPGGSKGVKATYNTALYTVAAASAALLYRAVHPGQLQLTSWTEPAAVTAAMLLFSAVVELGVPAVIAAASSRSFAATFRDGVAARCLQVATDLTLAVVAACAVVAQSRLLIVVAVLAVVLNLGYRSAAAARTERLFARQLIAALRAVGSAHGNRESVACVAAEQIVTLLSPLGAASAEVVLEEETGRKLYVHTVAGAAWSGPMSETPTGGRVAEVCAIAPQPAQDDLEQGAACGEVRVFFVGPVTPGEREREALAVLASTVYAALRAVDAHDALAAMAAAARHSATHDSVTDLPGPELLLETIDGHLAHCRTTGADRPSALVCLNLQGFAQILGAYPVGTAESLLRHAARQLSAGVGDTEKLAHIDGDTFAVWIPVAADVAYATGRAEHLLSVLAAQATAEPGPVVLSGVGGLVYALPSATPSGQELLRQAILALRTGHDRGQRITIYRAEDDARGQSGVVLASQLENALRHGGSMELVFRPTVMLATGEPMSVDAMPRWMHPTLGLLQPSQWMRVLEQSGLAGRYVPWLLDKALEAHHKWSRHGVRAPVVVRLPGPAMLDPALPRTVTAALERAQVSPDQLVIELTGRYVGATDTAGHALDELAGIGVGIAVDDTAEMSLERLCRMPASEIRLTRHTTELVQTDQATQARVSAIVALADKLELRVTARDVPTLAAAAALIRLHVHAGQGPYLGKPRDAEGISAAIKIASEVSAGVQEHGAKVINLPRRTD
jgi:diguanylate cyclase